MRSDHLTAADASFLAREDWGTHSHGGAVLVFDGEAPSYDEFSGHVEARLGQVPRYRQKLVFPRLGLGPAVWVDDPRFNLEYHVRITALPPPGGDDQLRGLVGRIFSQRLDRSKPLWELWLVHGLEHGHFALIDKTHHALVDGVTGLDITSVLFDTEPASVPAPPASRWTPEPEPSDAQLLARALTIAASRPAEAAEDAWRSVRDPGALLATAGGAASAIGRRAGLTSGPPKAKTPLATRVGGHRRAAWTRLALADLRRVRAGHGGSVNDAYLAVVAGALGTWLRSRGLQTLDLEPIACVPISVRDDGGRAEVVPAFIPLPVGARDPEDRVRRVREATAAATAQLSPLGADEIVELEDFAPPNLLAEASRASFTGRRPYDLLAINVPGPQQPLYLAGRRLEWLAPIGFLPESNALVIVAMSYDGHLEFGFLGDYEAVPDLDRFEGFVADALAELL